LQILRRESACVIIPAENHKQLKNPRNFQLPPARKTTFARLISVKTEPTRCERLFAEQANKPGDQ
jgi:hypothetical protein